MKSQFKLVLLLVLAVGTIQAAVTTNPQHLDTVSDNEIDVTHNLLLDKDAKNEKTSTAAPVVSDEVLQDLIEASKHSVALADDPRFNKMLPDNFKSENATSQGNTNNKNKSSVNKSEENYDDYYDYEEYLYDDETNNTTDTAKSAKGATNSKKSKTIEMKPIKDNSKTNNKLPSSKLVVDHKNDILENNDDYNDDDDQEFNDDLDDGNDDDEDDDDDDDDDDLGDEEEILFNENVPCPRYCVCARNINNYLVATCSRIDPETQKFGADITDLIVTDVSPKYPIYIGPEFFSKMGLKMVSSIKIANCTIQYLHGEAFFGLEELYSVNLTNVGLSYIDPNIFITNKKLRIVTISGNDLSGMTTLPYLLNSTSIEELDLSRNDLRELNPTAFSKLSSIIYINLSQNKLEKLPEKIFAPVPGIEELDLSSNELKSLPPGIFNGTTLAILQLKYNSFTGDLSFGNSELQQLDLSFNSIQYIHHGMFDKMTGLTNLILKGNGIKKIQNDSFLTLRNLRHIDLSINELDQISRIVFYKNTELDVIRLNDNPRLSQLPTDGFLSSNGYFTVYLFDVSNSAIGALGHKTFSSMPHLTTLRLAWNNINNLENDTFAGLTKLTELDLSNNLIKRLDEHIFKENNGVTKLNLAGNPMRKLPIRLLSYFNNLRELDVNDCELNSLIFDNGHGSERKYDIYDTLRVFNASLNQIKNISANDVKNFKNLHTLDITHNPLKCNENFQDFISYVSLNTKMVPQQQPNIANLESDATEIEFQPAATWANLAHEVCNHHKMQKSKLNLEEQIKLLDEGLDIDGKRLFSIMHNNKVTKMHKILEDSRKSEVVVDGGAEDSEDTDDMDNDDLKDEEDSDYENEDDDSEEDDDDYEENNDDFDGFDKDIDKLELPKAFDHGVKVEEVELNKETTDDYLLKKFLMDDESKSENSEEEIIIEHGRVYYTGYRFLVPLAIILLCVLTIFLVILKLLRVVMRKRGERYRMALLASSNNSIVYQKLTEEINAPVKESKQPKVHRYAPINQV